MLRNVVVLYYVLIIKKEQPRPATSPVLTAATSKANREIKTTTKFDESGNMGPKSLYGALSSNKGLLGRGWGGVVKIEPFDENETCLNLFW